MLYTIMPIEMVLADGNNAEKGQAGAAVMAELQGELQGAGVLCHPMPDGGARLERLLSTDPADFLRPELSPGEILYGLRMKAGR